MKRVFFLGAGFSATFGHPTMNEFFSFADSTDRLTLEQRSFLHRLLLDARRANSFLESSPTNLEDILSYAVMRDRLGLHEEEPLTAHLQDILRAIYGRVNDEWNFNRQTRAVQNLLGVKGGKATNALAVITTNYDINFEWAMFCADTALVLPFTYEPADSGRFTVHGRLYQRAGLPLFKLHGSVNWHLDEDGNLKEVADQVGGLTRMRDRHEEVRVPVACMKDYKAASSAMIVPPSFLKPELSAVLRAVWSGAARELQDAHEVIFVGYSFPQSDTEMMYFLAHSMAENPYLRRVVIIDPRADEIVARLTSMGSRAGSHFKALLNPMSMNWTEAKL